MATGTLRYFEVVPGSLRSKISEVAQKDPLLSKVPKMFKLEGIGIAHKKRTCLTDHPPLLFGPIIFFVLFILNFQIFPMFKSFYLDMWTKSFISSGVL